jgi:DNA polymerase (family 10)
MLELHAENPHRVRAFANAARAVERIEGDLDRLVTSGEILDIKGIGRGTAGVLSELIEGRRPAALSELEEKTPPGVKELLSIGGLGPKKARTLWRELEITSAGELEYACRENRLVELSGFGAKSQQRLLEAVQFLMSSRERRLVHQAWQAAEELRGVLDATPEIERIHVAGELRRRCETVGGLDLVVVSNDKAAVESALRRHLLDLVTDRDDMWTGDTGDGFQVRTRAVPPDNEAVALLLATGSAAHLESLRRRAEAIGLRIDDEVLGMESGPIPCPDEQHLYDALGCQWVPPELREDGDEVDRAAHGEIPDLVRLTDLRGALHNHTTDSDGADTVEEMGRAAGQRGWRFFGVADHSPAAHYANGLSADRLMDQWQRIDGFNSTEPVRVVKGLEADILTDGSLDIPDRCQDGLEYVVASIHSAFRLAADEQTARIVRAVKHPACRVLGHPTGRLLLARPGYPVDLEAVLSACAERGVTVEINASPYRLDLDWRWARRAIELGIQLVINPDAHAVDGLDDVRWGVDVARKAGATARDILNCGDIESWIAER